MTIAQHSAPSACIQSGWTPFGGGYPLGTSNKRVTDSQSVSTLAA